MKIVFMGSAAFAVPSLEALAASRHEIVEVVTQADKPAGRGMHIKACPAAEAARRLGLPVFQPKGVKDPEAIWHIRSLGAELIVVVAYGKILPAEILKIPPRGCVNVHASLLPKYRGAAPIAWAIANGERETGVTTQLITEELDAGDILLARQTPIGSAESASQLHDRLAPMGALLLLRTIEGLERRTIKPVPQDHSKATRAPIIKKEDGHIDWKKPAGEIFNRVRGLNPWPGTFTFLVGKQFIVHKAAALDIEQDAAPGTVVENQGRLAVACGEGTLYLMEVQPEGRKRMPAADFLRGHKVPVGTVLK